MVPHHVKGNDMYALFDIGETDDGTQGVMIWLANHPTIESARVHMADIMAVPGRTAESMGLIVLQVAAFERFDE